MTFGSLFAGIGGFDLGFTEAGVGPTWQVEINSQCRSVLGRHWPEVHRHDDVKTFHATNAVRPDIICGGFPCQDLSVAGKRAGLDGERSGLWHEFRRVIAEFTPQWVCIENVPGLLSSNSGRDMGIILRGLGELGYGWSYRVLDAQYFGVAQRRRRVFIVGCFGIVRRAAEVLFESDRLPWDSPPSRETGARPARTITGGVNPGGHNGRDDEGVIAATLNSGDHDGGFRTEPGEHLVTHTLRDGTGRGTPIIPIDMRQASRGATMTNNRTDGGAPGIGIGEDGEPSHTICDSHVPAVCFAQNQRDEIRTMEVVGALAAEPGMKQQSYVAFQTRIARNGRGQPKEVTDALTSCEGGTHADSKPHAAGPMGVRRLMPIECERLQGFPDNWTRYGHDGSELSDSARYRMLGNAVCVPVATWIGRRILNT